MKKIIISILVLLATGTTSVPAQQVSREELVNQYMTLLTLVGSQRSAVEKQLGEWGYIISDSSTVDISRIASWALKIGGANKDAHQQAKDLDVTVQINKYTLTRDSETVTLFTTNMFGKLYGIGVNFTSPDAEKVYAMTGDLSQLQNSVAVLGNASQYKGTLTGKKRKKYNSHNDMAEAMSEAGFEGTKTSEETFSDDKNMRYSLRYSNSRYGKKRQKASDMATLTFTFSDTERLDRDIDASFPLAN
ncbi:MAG: hypothetical protein AUK63_1986 [bacterium P3]|nr:MAG: hypothetical protein AUK63_1986 [bacterium P3]KWW34146.1 MAG: hypothetical protein F083_2483 [bacterium F083]